LVKILNTKILKEMTEIPLIQLNKYSITQSQYK
jgi:hypothetical protein